MTPIQKALSDIKFSIPKDILNIAFISRNKYYNRSSISLDTLIADLVIRNKVLSDCNVIDGVNISIALDQCLLYYVTMNPTSHHLVIEVPFSITGNRNIISPLSLTYSVWFNAPGSMLTYTNSALNLAETGMNALDTNATGISSTNLELIGNNTILVHDNIFGSVNGYIRVMVENARDMSNLKPRTYHNFSKLCIHATKAYIYNTLITEIDKGIIYGGHALTRATEIIESYSDALNDYNEFLETTWRKTAFMNDSVRYSSFIQAKIRPVV